MALRRNGFGKKIAKIKYLPVPPFLQECQKRGRVCPTARGNGATVQAKVVKKKNMGMANMISSSNRMAMVWSAFLCLGPNCKLHK